MPFKLNLGPKIKMLREIKGVSQESLAVDIGLNQQAFQKIEDLFNFHPANYLSQCTNSGVFNTNNVSSDQLIGNMENHIANLQEEIKYLREQNSKLLEIVK